MKKSAIVLLIAFLLSNHRPCEAEDEQHLVNIPIFTSEYIDVIAAKMKFLFNDEEARDIGTGFFISDGAFIYLVSARHVLLKALELALSKGGTLIVIQKYIDRSRDAIYGLEHRLNIAELWESGALRVNLNPDVDVGILRLKELKKIEGVDRSRIIVIRPGRLQTGAESQQFPESTSLLINDPEFMCQFADIKIAEDVYYFGFPSLPIRDQGHELLPIVRRAIVSKFIDGRKVVIDGGFTWYGNSGSPVLVRRFQIGSNGRFRIQFSLIGMITALVPTQVDPQKWENSNLSIVESIDNIRDTLTRFNERPEISEDISER